MAHKWTSKDKVEILLSATMVILMIVALYIGNNIVVNINEVNEELDRTTKIIAACNACQEPEEESKLIPLEDNVEIADVNEDEVTRDSGDVVAGTD